MLSFEGLGDVFEEDEAKRDVFVFRGLQVAPELVGRFEQLGLKTQIAAAARLCTRHYCAPSLQSLIWALEQQCQPPVCELLAAQL